MNDSVKSVVSLVVICLVVTLALSAVNYFTAPVIAENNAMLILWSAYCIIYSPNPPPYSIPCSPR